MGHPGFKNIIHNSKKMSGLISRSEIIARNSATVLIQGESGAGMGVSGVRIMAHYF